VLLGVAFLVPALGLLAWVAFVPLLVALEDYRVAGAGVRRLFGLGYLFGFSFFLIGSHWIALLSDVAITVPWLKYPAWVAAAAYLALFGGLGTALAGTLARRSGVGLAWVFPVAWLAVEELRGSGELGFPWFQPGYAFAAFPPFIQMASLGGVTLVTLWVLAVNVLAWRAMRGRARLRAGIGAALVVLLPLTWGLRALDAADRAPGPTIALIQANIAGEIKWSGRHQREVLAAFLTLSDSAASVRPAPGLIIWPETATGSYLRRQLDQAIEVARFTARTEIPVFAGFADYGIAADGRPRYTNAAGLFTPRGVPDPVYAKRHLVPFGERMPFQWLLPGLGRIELGQAEWTPGSGPVLFPSVAGRFGCLICFESIFPDLAREDVRRGARWLVNVTNDEWFGNSAALDQHAAMAALRAVENHVPLARCANTGLTELLDANGRVTRALPVFRPGILVAPLARPGPPTPFTRLGAWPGALAGLGVLALALAAVRRALTGRTNRG